MTERRLLSWSLTCVILAAFAVWLEPTRVVWGWLRGEAFFEGRPTSHWEEVLDSWELWTWYDHSNPRFGRGGLLVLDVEEKQSPFLKPNRMQQRLHGYFGTGPVQQETPAILMGHPAARAVLFELSNSLTQHTKELAAYGLTQIEQQENARRVKSESPLTGRN